MASALLDVAVVAVFLVMVRRGAFLRARVVPLVRLRDELRQEWGDGPRRWPDWAGSLVTQIEEFGDFRRLLIVAGVPDGPVEWVARSFGLAVVVLAVCTLADGALYTSQGGLVVPVWAALALATLVVPWRALRLLQRARRRRIEASSGLGAMFKLFGVLGRRPLRHHAHLDQGDPLLILARCLRRKTLLEMLTDPRWPSLVAAPTTTAEWLESFGEAYGIEEAHQLATVVRNSSEGSEAAQSEEYVRAGKMWLARWRAQLGRLYTTRNVRRMVFIVPLLLPLLIVILSSLIGSATT